MKNENCIFCKLANGEIPTATLYEDEDFRVILDASPAAKGHALIIPKEHYANLYELDDELAAKVLATGGTIASKESGQGLTSSIRDIRVPLPEPGPLRLDDLWFRAWTSPGWAAAVCGHSEPPEKIFEKSLDIPTV